MDRILTPDFVRELAQSSAARLDQDMARLDHEIGRVTDQIAKLETAMARLLDAVEQDGSEAARERLREREVESYQLGQKLRALEQRRREGATHLSDEMLQQALTGLRYNLSVGNVRQKRALLRTFVDHIDADKERARLWYTFPVLPLEKCPQRNSNPRRHLERVVS